MTISQTVSTMRRAADALARFVQNHGDGPMNSKPEAELFHNEDAAVGAAALLCYLRDLITAGTAETYDRGTLLVLLETISRDAELFPAGVGVLIWEAEAEVPHA